MATQHEEHAFEQDIDALEDIIDRHGLKHLTLLICHIATEKADHIRSNDERDAPLADDWDDAGDAFTGINMKRLPT